jgi:hypothetical protein
MITERIVRVRPFEMLGLGYAFATGCMHGARNPHVERYSFDELRESWDVYRQDFLSRRTRNARPSWAEYVFEQGFDPEEARRALYDPAYR